MKFNILYDISMTISPEMQVYKGRDDKKPVIEVRSDHNTGTSYVTLLSCDLHLGTHVDAPLHMIRDGETMDYFGLDKVFSPALLLDLTAVEGGITAADLADKEIEAGQVVLLKTKNSFEERINDFIYLEESGARYLVEKGIKGVGIDTPGIERDQEGHPTHKALLGQGIFIVEGLVLGDVPAGKYPLLLAPLKIAGVEASLARAFLLEAEED